MESEDSITSYNLPDPDILQLIHALGSGRRRGAARSGHLGTLTELRFFVELISSEKTDSAHTDPSSRWQKMKSCEKPRSYIYLGRHVDADMTNLDAYISYSAAFVRSW